MAFCRYCGNEIPEGGACNCIAAVAARTPKKEAPKVSAGGYDPAFGVRNAQGETVDPNAGEKRKRIIILSAIGAVLLTILIIFLFNHLGARGTARKYAKNIYSKKGGKTYYSLTLPDDLYKNLKGDKLNDMVDEFNDSNKDTIDDYKVKLKKVDKSSKMDSKQLNGAEKYFATHAGAYDKNFKKVDFSAKKGYIYTLKYKIKDRHSKKTKTYVQEIAVVKFSGEGWKVIDPDVSEYSGYESLKEYLKVLGGGKKNNKTVAEWGF